MLDLAKESKSRILSAYHAYGAMNKDRVASVIDLEWTESILLDRHTDEEKAMAIPPVPISFRNATLKRLLQAEPSSVQAEVEAWRHAKRAAQMKTEGEVDEESARLEKAKQYHQ